MTLELTIKSPKMGTQSHFYRNLPIFVISHTRVIDLGKIKLKLKRFGSFSAVVLFEVHVLSSVLAGEQTSGESKDKRAPR